MNAANGDPFRELLELLPEGERRDGRRVLIVDAQPVNRFSLAGLLDRAGCDVRGALNGCADLAANEKLLLECDFVLVDPLEPGAALKDSLTAIKGAIRKFPRVAFVILTSFNDLLSRTRKIGARGYLLKSDSPETVLQALAAMEKGERFISPSIAQHPENRNERTALKAVYDLLTKREREVLLLTVEKQTAAQIASAFGVKVCTVNKHRENISKKLKHAGARPYDVALYHIMQTWGAVELAT